ncbi:MAG: thioredoxin [Ilumatobacteraceae bacterium]|jgi:thioredoxin 2|nr:thioredoxin [Ilumatobacteraceae bacterium]
MNEEQPAVESCTVCGRKNRVPAAAAGVPRCGQCGSPLPWTAVADDRSYREVVEGAALPVVVDLWAPWCGPCRTISPALEKLARSYAGRIKLVKVNVDESPLTAGRHRVQGIPTLLIVDHAEVVASHVGAAPEHVLRKWVDDTLTTLGRAFVEPRSDHPI